jgi:hypothetical protein
MSPATAPDVPELPPRPLWVPKGVIFRDLPAELQIGIKEIINPAYVELVLQAATAREKAAALTFVHLLWLGLVDQIALNKSMADALIAGSAVYNHREWIAAHLRLLGAQEKYDRHLLRLAEFREKQTRSWGAEPGLGSL